MRITAILKQIKGSIDSGEIEYVSKFSMATESMVTRVHARDYVQLVCGTYLLS